MNFTREPIAIINGVTAIVEAAIALLVGFGLDWSAEQVALVMALVVAVANVVKTWFGRAKVTPVADPVDDEGRRLYPAPLDQ